MAITAALFAAIAGTMAIRQRSNEFVQSVQDVRGQLQQTISEVQAGRYQDIGDFSCTNSGSSNIKINAGSDAQGSHHDCIFLGDVIQFGIGADNTGYRVFPIAARADATSMSNSGAMVIYDSSDSIDASTGYETKYGLNAVSVDFNGATTQPGAVAILSSFQDTSNGSSGVQQIDVYGLSKTKMGQPYNNSTVNQIDTSLKNSYTLNPPGGVEVCFASGGSNQSGLITIGGDNRQLSVELEIFDNKTCT